MSLVGQFVNIQWALLHLEGIVIIGVDDEVYDWREEGDFE